MKYPDTLCTPPGYACTKYSMKSIKVKSNGIFSTVSFLFIFDLLNYQNLFLVLHYRRASKPHVCDYIHFSFFLFTRFHWYTFNCTISLITWWIVNMNVNIWLLSNVRWHFYLIIHEQMFFLLLFTQNIFFFLSRNSSYIVFFSINLI